MEKNPFLFGGPEEKKLKEVYPRDKKKVDEFLRKNNLKTDSYKELSENATLKDVQKTELRDSKDGYYVLNSINKKKRFPIGKDSNAEIESALSSQANFVEKILEGGEESLNNQLSIVKKEIRIYENYIHIVNNELEKMKGTPLNAETQEIINDYEKEHREYSDTLGALKVREMQLDKEIKKVKLETLGHITARKAKGPEYLKDNLSEDDFMSLN